MLLLSVTQLAFAPPSTNLMVLARRIASISQSVETQFPRLTLVHELVIGRWAPNSVARSNSRSTKRKARRVHHYFWTSSCVEAKRKASLLCAFVCRPYPALAPFSRSCSRSMGTLSILYYPFCRFTHNRSRFLARLACLIHAASVRSEPGSNSPKKRVNSG